MMLGNDKVVCPVPFSPQNRMQNESSQSLPCLRVPPVQGRKRMLWVAPDTSRIDDEAYRQVVNELFYKTILPDILALESGKLLLNLAGHRQYFAGTLHMIIGMSRHYALPVTAFSKVFVGDDIGQRQIAGLLGPRAVFSSRYSVL
jgi:hypothetical protein